MVKIKICGITNLEDAAAAAAFGADALGFVFYRKSPRYINPRDAASIIKRLPSFIPAVGVFANDSPKRMEEVISDSGIDLVQLHGDEKPEACSLSRRIIKAIRVKNLDSLLPLEGFRDIVSAFLLDTYTPDTLGGSGMIFNWDIAVEAKQLGRIILAGGLNPGNVAEAIHHVKPYGVDVSSGVELRKGKKNHEKMRLFIERAKAA